jgi:hypothetical protein
MLLVNPTLEEAAINLAKNKDKVTFDRILSAEDLATIRTLWENARSKIQLVVTIRNGKTHIEEK